MEVSVPVLQAIVALPEAIFHSGLAHLHTVEFLYERRRAPTRACAFTHVLTQEAAYQSLLKHTRQQVHQRIAQVLKAQFPAITQRQPEVLALHYTAAGLAAEAVAYWQRAGAYSHAQSAYVEAIVHCTTGLEVLTTLPDTPVRIQQGLDIQLTLGTALQVTKGYAAPEAGRAMARARELCRQVGDTPQLIEALWGVGVFYQHQGDLQTARELFAQCLALAERLPAPAFLVRAHVQMGVCLFFLGEVAAAHAHLTQAMALCAPQQDHSLAFFHSQDDLGQCLGYTSGTLWMLVVCPSSIDRL